MTERALAAVVAGPPGAGKSTFGAALAQALRGALLDKDVMTAPLVAVAMQARGLDPTALDDPWYRRHVRPAVYDTLHRTVASIVAIGTPVVLIAPFLREVTTAGWTELTRQRFGGPDLRLVWVRADTDVLRARMTARAATRDAAKLASWAPYVRTLHEVRPEDPHDVVDTSALTISQMEKAAMSLAASWTT